MSSSLDLPLGDLIASSRSSSRGGGRQGGGGRRDRRGGAKSSADGSSSSANPLDRTTDTSSSSGPIRHDRRRERAPRSEQQLPYARSSNRDSNGQWSRGADLIPTASSITKLVGDTVRLSNLSSEMSEDDLRYVFEKIGPIKGITIHYNSAGKSVGTAEIQFGNTAAADLAVENLDQAEVDGRIMYVAIIGTQVVQSSYPLVQRRDDRRSDNRRSDDRREDRPRGERRDGGDRQRRDGGRQGGDRKEGGRGGRKEGGGGGRGGRNGGREARTEPKPADLDAEMDSYHSARASATAAAPAAATESAAPAAAAE